MSDENKKIDILRICKNCIYNALCKNPPQYNNCDWFEYDFKLIDKLKSNNG